MNTDLPVSEEQGKAFADTFLGNAAKVPFGSLSKRDMECLMLHSLLKSGILHYESNRQLANALEVNETRLKGYLVDVRYKYVPDVSSDNVAKIVREVLANRKVKVIHDNGHFSFPLEDPVLKLDFEDAMKSIGYFSDSSFNKDVVKVKDYTLVAFLFRYNNNDNTYADLQKNARGCA